MVFVAFIALMMKGFDVRRFPRRHVLVYRRQCARKTYTPCNNVQAKPTLSYEYTLSHLSWPDVKSGWNSMLLVRLRQILAHTRIA